MDSLSNLNTFSVLSIFATFFFQVSKKMAHAFYCNIIMDKTKCAHRWF